MARSIVSIINGRPAEGPAAGAVDSPNPSRLTDVVAEVTLADADTFAAACAAAKRAQPLWAGIPATRLGRAVAPAVGRHPPAVRRREVRGDRPHRRGEQGGAGPPGHPRARQAVPGGA